MIYVMSDLHGMYDKYIQMLASIHFCDEDVLYILGDVIDRGRDGIKILQDVMKRSNITLLCGNHEWMMAQSLDIIRQPLTNEYLEQFDDETVMLLTDWIYNGAKPTIACFRTLSNEEQDAILTYVSNLTYYKQLSVNHRNFLLVHAGVQGFDENKPLDSYPKNAFLWIRPDWSEPYYQDENTYVIVGHTPVQLMSQQAKIFHSNRFIDLDCGACFDHGALGCLCLDTMEEFYV